MSGDRLRSCRADFPPLGPAAAGERLPVYFDNACTTLRPRQVMAAMAGYYERHPACHKRAVHAFGRETSERYDAAREAVRRFLNAGEAAEIVFTRNTTEAVNLVARSFPFRSGDAVLTTDAEHNSNFVPWLELARQGRISHRTVPVAADGSFDLDGFARALEREPVRLVSVFSRSHVTGAALPVAAIIRLAHDRGAQVLVDAAQSPLHERLDVRALGADFLALSFHKMLGPSGTGALYGRREALETLHPFLLGGETVADVSEESYVSAGIPSRFEAGLQNYAGAMGVEAAILYLEGLDFAAVGARDRELNSLVTEGLRALKPVRILGPADPALRGSVVNFTVEGMDCGELSILLDKTEGIMTRSGVHCCHSWYRKNGLSPSLRLSLAFYNTVEEAELFLRTLRNIVRYSL